ncbi:MAG: hypothetical protein GWN14_17440 [candidate division Zixibacteria bacterium]|nr:hypothetical protein [candidate division Zixibacteria bacterium]
MSELEKSVRALKDWEDEVRWEIQDDIDLETVAEQVIDIYQNWYMDTAYLGARIAAYMEDLVHQKARERMNEFNEERD